MKRVFLGADVVHEQHVEAIHLDAVAELGQSGPAQVDAIREGRVDGSLSAEVPTATITLSNRPKARSTMSWCP